MVFKTTRVGSIPATLDITKSSSILTKNSNSNKYRRNYKQSFLQPNKKVQKHKVQTFYNGYPSVKATSLSSRVLIRYGRVWKPKRFTLKGFNSNFFQQKKKKRTVAQLINQSYKSSLRHYKSNVFFKFKKFENSSALVITRIPSASYWLELISLKQFKVSSNTINQLNALTVNNVFTTQLITSNSSKLFKTSLPLIELPSVSYNSAPLSRKALVLNTTSSLRSVNTLSYFTWLKLNKVQTKSHSYISRKSENSVQLLNAFLKMVPAQGLESRLRWLSLKRKLSLWNKKFKNKFLRKKSFIFFSYAIPKEFSRSKFTRRFIPELPYALRGSFVSKNQLPKNLTIFNASEPLGLYNLLARNSSNSQLGFTLNRLANKSNNHWSIIKRRKSKRKSFRSLFSQKLQQGTGFINSSFRNNQLNSCAPVRTERLLMFSQYKKALKSVSLQQRRRFFKKRKSTIRRVSKLIPRLRYLRRNALRKVRFCGKKTRKLRKRVSFKRRKIIGRLKRLWSNISRFRLAGIRLRSFLRKYRFKKVKNNHLQRLGKDKGSTHSSNTNLRSFLKKNSKYYNTLILQNIDNSLLVARCTNTDLPSIKSTVPLNSLKSNTELNSDLSTNLQVILSLWSSPIILRLMLKSSLLKTDYTKSSVSLRIVKIADTLQTQLAPYFFGTRLNNLNHLNTWNVPTVNITLRKKLMRAFVGDVFVPKVATWYYQSLIRFMENCTGRKVALHIGPFVDDVLTFEDKALCYMWSYKVKGFQRMLGPRIFVTEGLDIVASSLRLKDPTFLANWIRAMLKRMSFWKFRLLFRYIKFLITHLFHHSFQHFQFKGFKLRLKGKISVAGNARTRALHLRIGNTSHSKMTNRVAYDLSYFGTFTGVLGLKLWFFY